MGHPRFHLHFTPTSASWLNVVETWFGQLERRALRRGIFTRVTELREAILAGMFLGPARARGGLVTQTAAMLVLSP